MKVLSLAWVHIRRWKWCPTQIVAATTALTHAKWGLIHTVLFSLQLCSSGAPTPTPFWEVLPTFRKVLSSLSPFTHISLLYAPSYMLLDVYSALMYLSLLKLRFTMSHHNPHISIPGILAWSYPLRQKLPRSSWYRTVHYDFFYPLGMF